MPRGDPTVVKRIPESLVERLASFAREGESWTDVLERMVERAEAGRSKGEHYEVIVSPAHFEAERKALARREVETRFKG